MCKCAELETPLSIPSLQQQIAPLKLRQTLGKRHSNWKLNRVETVSKSSTKVTEKKNSMPNAICNRKFEKNQLNKKKNYREQATSNNAEGDIY